MDSTRNYYTATLGKVDFEVHRRYVNLKPVGRGSYGLVASADDTFTGRKVAIKRVSRVFQDLVDAKRILREIKLLRHLSGHDNINEITDIMTGPPETEDFHTLYIVTVLFDCDLERIVTSPQPLTDQHAQYFLYQVLRGLKFMHSANVLHRDLKPSNLLVNTNCDLAICDFGLARGITAMTGKVLTEYVATRWYRAPELLCCCERYGPAVDIWSVGCIFAEILGRKPFFKGSSTREQLEQIVKKLGTPASSELVAMGCSPGSQGIVSGMAHVEPRSLLDQLPGTKPAALDLLSRMLCFDPAKRIGVQEALAHPYLADLHSRAREPRCATTFDFAFEAPFPDEMPQPLLQRLMFAEMGMLRKEREADIANKELAEALAREAAAPADPRAVSHEPAGGSPLLPRASDPTAAVPLPPACERLPVPARGAHRSGLAESFAHLPPGAFAPLSSAALLGAAPAAYCCPPVPLPIPVPSLPPGASGTPIGCALLPVVLGPGAVPILVGPGGVAIPLPGGFPVHPLPRPGILGGMDALPAAAAVPRAPPSHAAAGGGGCGGATCECMARRAGGMLAHESPFARPVGILPSLAAGAAS